MRKIKSVYFDMQDDEERAMFEFLTRKGMFSRNVKRVIREAMRKDGEVEKPIEVVNVFNDSFEGLDF